MVTEEQVVDVIKTIYDPEIPVNIFDLGLIYGVGVTTEGVSVKMTLTSQGCPAAQQIPETVRKKIQDVLKVTQVQVDIVWEPAWHPTRISPEGKKILKIES